MAKGLSVDVYRSKGCDCTNGGVSSNKDEFILVGIQEDGKPVAPVFDAKEGETLELAYRRIGDYVHIYCKPVGETRHVMFGGNFIYTSDSRFPSKQPIPIHDRIE